MYLPSYFTKGILSSILIRIIASVEAEFKCPYSMYWIENLQIWLKDVYSTLLAGRLKVWFFTLVIIVILHSLYGSRHPKTYNWIGRWKSRCWLYQKLGITVEFQQLHDCERPEPIATSRSNVNSQDTLIFW